MPFLGILVAIMALAFLAAALPLRVYGNFFFQTLGITYLALAEGYQGEGSTT